MPYATALLTLFSVLAVVTGVGVPEKYQPDQRPKEKQETLANSFHGLDDEDTAEDEIEDLLGRMGQFRQRAERARTSKSEEAVMARFFQGLDDDDDDEDGDSPAGTFTVEGFGEAIVELLTTGKVTEGLESLLEAAQQPTVEQIDPTGGEGSSDSVTQASEEVQPDPPAVIKTYYDLHPTDGEESLSEEENPIVLLNRFNFHNNVMSSRDDEVEHWIIRFCHEWYSPCSRMLPAYKDLARKSEQALNQDITSLKTTVRFAEVDCSTDKPLCNEQGAEYYPGIIHYHRGRQVSKWEAEAGGQEEDVEAMNVWMRSESKSILQSRLSARTNIHDVMKPGAVNLESGLIWSCASIVVTLLAHAWLVHGKSQGSKREFEAEGVVKDRSEVVKQSAASAARPSGLASMLPEEWVSEASEKQLLEL